MSYFKQKPPVTASSAGRLGVLIPGMGAVGTTFMAGVLAIRRGLHKPFGALTQMGHIRLGKRTDNQNPLINEFVDLSGLDDLVFGGWDIYERNCFEEVKTAGVLRDCDVDPLKDELSQIKPMPAVFDQAYVKNISGPNVKTGSSKMDLADQLIADIENFKTENNLARLVMVWCGSTEVYQALGDVHNDLDAFEAGLKQSDPRITPSMIYGYAALKTGTPYANGAPNLSVEIPALAQLANQLKIPICGKDFKTGQTLMKTILAPGFKARLLGLNGWFSTNILGNRDGEVLDDPGSFKSKEATKLSVLDTILQPKSYPSLYGDYYHKVRINYYPPRGDNKEGWDNIDIFGWMGYEMQIKIDFLCRDSILAAPLVLDLVLFLDLAQRSGMYGIQEWLSFYFKSPITLPSLYPEHDLFIQLAKLKNTLRFLKGEDLITHLGLDYYE